MTDVSAPGSLMDLAQPKRCEPFSALEIHTAELALREIWALLIADKPWRETAKNLLDEVGISSSIVSKFDQVISDVVLWKRHPILELLSETVDPFPAFDAKNTSRQKKKHGQDVFDTVPDFFFRRKTKAGRSPMQEGLFIEAKIVDQKKPVWIYCSTGLMRYVDGRYAWAMPQALMLGYIRKPDQTLPKALADYLGRHGKINEYLLRSGPTAFALSRFACRVHETVHRRTAPHPITKEPCGDITVYHLWLNV